MAANDIAGAGRNGRPTGAAATTSAAALRPAPTQTSSHGQGSGSVTPAVGEVALSVKGLCKVFPGTRALDDVALEVRYGQVLALCGGNGCGKSTVIKVLSGVLAADRGEIMIGGRRVEPLQLTAQESFALGFRVVHQDPPLYPDMSIAENLMLAGSYPVGRSAKISWRSVAHRTRELLEEFDIDADPSTLIRDLPVSVRTQVAIAAALQDVQGKRCIVALDEPTAALPAAEVKLLLTTIRQLTAKGHAIIIVSHRLDEVLAVSDRVTVMRDGQVFRQHDTQTLTESELIESIVGRSADLIKSRPGQTRAGQTILTVTDLSAGPLQDVSFDVRAGEVIGIAGLLGSGRTELLQALFGDLPVDAGQVTFQGRPVQFRRIDQAIKAGVVMIPEDRANGGAFRDMTVNENMDMTVLSRYWKGIGFRRSRMLKDASDLRTKFRVKAASGSVPMRTLSGGNQQKAILARWLRGDASLLLLDEPSQGVDVGARSDIYNSVREVTTAGGAAIVVASDLEELAQFVDRALVLRAGRVTAHVSREELTAHHLNHLVHMQSGMAS